MGCLDLRNESGMRGSIHYALRVRNVDLVYCYIRKNACTAFKVLFNEESQYRQNKVSSSISLHFMHSFHKASEEAISHADFRVCVLRKPEERVVSLFKNKFIQQLGHEDLIASYLKLVGEDPQSASFKDFCLKYLKAAPLWQLDPHLYSQRSHLLPIYYNAALELKDLVNGMSKIIGHTLAEKYFSAKQNATSDMRVVSLPNAFNIPARELHQIYLTRRTVPCTRDLLDDSLLACIRNVYEMDYRLLRMYKSDNTVISDSEVELR